MAERHIYSNGVNGSSGDYLFEPASLEDFAASIVGVPRDKAQQSELKQAQRARNEGTLGLSSRYNPDLLPETGWGVVFAYNVCPEIVDALRPLLDHRRAEATQIKSGRYQEFRAERSVRPLDDGTIEPVRKWLARQGVSFGTVDPDHGVPYYLLLVGSPTEIPYTFQYQLDLQYAVGRLHFDTVAEYATYAHSVVAAETTGLTRSRTITLGAVANPDDWPTQASATYLIPPLAQALRADARLAAQSWQIEQLEPALMTKAHVLPLIGGTQARSLLFTASHGMGFDVHDQRLRAQQGALLCQDWPGRSAWGRQPIPQDFYLAADDISDSAHVWGSISFHFACYGAGTPLLDGFAHQQPIAEGRAEFAAPQPIAIEPFVAQLPQRLLAHPNGGALAVIGHVDRAWNWSFQGEQSTSYTVTFQEALTLMMLGKRVGYAFETFNERYSDVGTQLSDELENVKFGKRYDPLDLSLLWTTANDARSYIILGDPAVRLTSAADTLPVPPAPPITAAGQDAQ